MTLRVVVIGAGGHAKVLIETLQLQGAVLVALTDAAAERRGRQVLGWAVSGGDELVLAQDAARVRLVNALGSVNRETLERRRAAYERFTAHGFRFLQVVHGAAIVSSHAQLGEGVQVMAGVVIQPGTDIGANCIVNTSASIDHDCTIGAHCHIAPGVRLSGGVELGDQVHVGTGAVVVQGVRIGVGAIIGAGAVVLENVDAGATVRGNRE